MPKDLAAGAGVAVFADLLAMIEQARARAARAVNLELVGLYWNVGAYVSERTRTEGWGNAVIARFSESVRRRFPGITGFSPVNIWRMRTFYDAYAGREDLSALLKKSAGPTTRSSFPARSQTRIRE